MLHTAQIESQTSAPCGVSLQLDPRINAAQIESQTSAPVGVSFWLDSEINTAQNVKYNQAQPVTDILALSPTAAISAMKPGLVYYRHCQLRESRLLLLIFPGLTIHLKAA